MPLSMPRGYDRFSPAKPAVVAPIVDRPVTA
jgi:hypothetical protein